MTDEIDLSVPDVPQLSMEQLLQLAERRDETLALLDKLDAEESLLGYTRLMWPVLEPGRDFVVGWAIEAICEHLEAVSNGEILRLLMNVPPGMMKSLSTEVFWPSWEWGPRRQPWMRYVSVSYNGALTIRDNRRTRQLIVDPTYELNWGRGAEPPDPGQRDVRCVLSDDEANKIKLSTTATGFKFASSIGGTVMGERGDRVIIDDPNNTKEVESEAALDEALQFLTEVLPTRINDARTSAIVCIMQRTHELDVSGHIIANELNYEHLMLPMEFEEQRRCSTSIGFSDPRTEEGELLFPERFPREYLEEDLKPTLRSWGGTYAESGQLQQRPSPRGGGLFQKDDWQYCDVAPSPVYKEVRGWDFAGSKKKKSPVTAGVKLGLMRNGGILVMDCDKGRWSPGEVETNVKRVANADGPRVQISIPQDPGQAGKAQVRTFATLLHGFDVHSSVESGSKEDRARPFAAQVELGNVWILRGPWNLPFVNEAAVFPAGAFKDQIDAASRAYAKLIGTNTSGVGGVPEVVAA